MFNSKSNNLTMKNLYLLAIKSREHPLKNNYFIFLTLDSLWRNGSFLFLKKPAERGTKVAYLGGLKSN